MPTKKKKYNARFPPARIKKIMQMDEEVGKVAAPVPVIISRALELFVESLLHKSSETTQSRNAKTLTTSHIKQTILSDKKYDFMKELVRNVSDVQPIEDDCEKPKGRDSSSTGPRKCGRPKKKLSEDAAKEVAPKRRGRKKKLEEPVLEVKKEIETRSSSSSDTDIADPEANDDENDSSYNEDRETDTDMENEDESAPICDRVFAGPSRIDHSDNSSVHHSSESAVARRLAEHSFGHHLSQSNGSETAMTRHLPESSGRYPSPQIIDSSGVNPMFASGDNTLSNSNPWSAGQASNLFQQGAVAAVDAVSHQVSPAMHDSASFEMCNEMELPNARPTHPVSTRCPVALSNNQGLGTHRMPPILSLSMSAIHSHQQPYSPRPLTPLPAYRTQDPMSSAMPAVNESNRFH